jgi:N-methylhydantoinase A
MRQNGERLLRGEGIAAAAHRFEAAADLHYVGQYDDITVPLGQNEWNGTALQDLVARFHRRHDELNGYALPEQACEISALHLTSIGVSAKPALPQHKEAQAGASHRERRIVLDGHETRVPVYLLENWRRGDVVSGPCIVELPASTLLVLEGYEAGIDAHGNLLAYLSTRRDFAERIGRA